MNNAAPNIYSSNDVVYIQNSENIKGDIIIYNLIGQEILKKKSVNEDLERIKITQGTGYYLVKVQSEKQVVTKKVFIK
ncbi:MAG: T9SS type A sorting domain-containing protein [Bacteroidales bacterium]|nr:T9SS type A sorting domain-containing protein [Bacteroidales bacterium]